MSATLAHGGRRPSRRSLTLAGLVAFGLAATVLVTGGLNRVHDAAKLQTWTDVNAIPTVAVVTPTPATAGSTLVLPGNLHADYNAAIYSRVSGYVHDWYVDIGGVVKAGQTLALIDTPELDQQLIQARADLVSSEASMQLARTTAKRWASLLKQDAVSAQEADEKAGDLATKTAQVDAAKANVERLVALKSFSRITAPFDGVVTARRTDIGALVNAGAGATASSELFEVAKVDRLRLYVHVPQVDSARIHPGMTASLTVPEYPGRNFTATLTSTSEAVSENSGTLLVELSVDNRDRALKAGDYAQVEFELKSTGDDGSGVLRVPASALLFRGAGLQAAIVDPSNRVILRKVTVAHDLGQTIEIASGLKPTDRVIDNPPDSIAAGDQVHVQQADAGTGGHDAAE